MKMCKKLLALLMCVAMLFSVLPAAWAAEDNNTVRLIFTDATVGCKINGWSVDKFPQIDKTFKREGTASYKVGYKAGAGQSAATFDFSSPIEITEENRKTAALSFWYYAETDLPGFTVAFTNRDTGSENRISVKGNYINENDVNSWKYIEIPLSEFADDGEIYNNDTKKWEKLPFDFKKIDSINFYAYTVGAEAVGSVWLDQVAIIKTGTKVFEEAPSVSEDTSTDTNDQPIKIFDDQAVGTKINFWNVALPTAISKEMKKEGDASVQINFKPETSQSASSFEFNTPIKITQGMRDYFSLGFWYYSDGSIKGLSCAFTNKATGSENRIQLSGNYISTADKEEWKYVEIPLSALAETGQIWSSTESKWVDIPFDFNKIDALNFYGYTVGDASVEPIYLDRIEIAKTGSFVPPVEKHDPVSYYVSPKGSDSNDGKSPEKPFKSIQLAADKTKPGDTVYLMGGLYEYNGYGTFLTIRKSGTADAYITYTAYNDEEPILKAHSGWNHVEIFGSYIKFENITIEGVLTKDLVAQGLENYEEAAKNQDTGASTDWNKMSLTNTNGISIGGRNMISAGIDVVSHVEIRNCTIRRCTGIGVGAAAADYITIEDNDIHSNGWSCMYAVSGISVLGLKDTDDNTKDYKIIIRGNKVYDNECMVPWLSIRKLSDGNGIILDSTISSEYGGMYNGKILVENNLSYDNGGSGIHAFKAANADIRNNTVYNNSRSTTMGYAQLFSSQSKNIKIYNNIVYARPGSRTISSDSQQTTVFANNILFNGEQSEKIQGYNNVYADPKFVDLANYDFHLQADSPAIDWGLKIPELTKDLDGNKRPQGAELDSGCYETSYTSANPVKENTLDLDALVVEKPFTAKEAEAVFGTPVVDGTIDAVWENAQKISVTNVLSNMTQGRNATATTRTLWDNENLYVLVEVADGVLNAVHTDAHQQDSVEIFVDENEARGDKHDADDGQFRTNYQGAVTGGPDTDLTRYNSVAKVVDGGYVIEASIKLTAIKPAVGAKMGFDVQINDDTGAGSRSACVDWCDPEGKGYSTSKKFGRLIFVETRSSEYPMDDDAMLGAIKVKLNGKYLVSDVAPIMESDRVLVPMRAIFEALGAEVEWFEETETVTGKKGDMSVKLQINNTAVEVNGEARTLDVPARLVNSRTLVPIRFVSESLNAKVDWEDATQTVIIVTE